DALHTAALDSYWGQVVDDPQLAAQWQSLGELHVGTLGRGVADFYRDRGFVFPGLPGSAPPLLAQHDWVHVLAGYGTALENEIELVPKDPAALAAGSAGPWQVGGITEYQLAAARAAAAAADAAYRPWQPDPART